LVREAADAVLGVERVTVLVETADLVLALAADDVLLLPWGSAAGGLVHVSKGGCKGKG
jgi:hypothetical protein